VLGDRATTLRALEACYRADRTEFAHRFGMLAEKDGVLAGIAVAFPARLYGSLKLGTGVVLARTAGPRHVVELAARARVLNRLLPGVDRGYLYLSVLAVTPERRGAGIGSALLERVIGGAGRMGLGVATDTAADERARDLYARFGFRVVSLRETSEEERRTIPVDGMVRMELPPPR
jgi:ribosomal protein S18 acetylase RimI-like enzyme